MVALLPIILGVAALGSGLAQGISAVKNTKEQAKAAKQSAEDQIEERSRQAKYLMQEQKTSFLKGGVYFDSGSPTEVLNETYDTMKKDVNAIANDANREIKNLNRQGKTAFFNSLVQATTGAALSYFGLGGTTGSLSSSNTGTKLYTWFKNLGGYKGGFGDLPTGGLPGTGSNKLA